jgi:hypothetical protein
VKPLDSNLDAPSDILINKEDRKDQEMKNLPAAPFSSGLRLLKDWGHDPLGYNVLKVRKKPEDEMKIPKPIQADLALIGITFIGAAHSRL